MPLQPTEALGKDMDTKLVFTFVVRGRFKTGWAGCRHHAIENITHGVIGTGIL